MDWAIFISVLLVEEILGAPVVSNDLCEFSFHSVEVNFELLSRFKRLLREFSFYSPVEENSEFQSLCRFKRLVPFHFYSVEKILR
jgi:hypothetical protein